MVYRSRFIDLRSAFFLLLLHVFKEDEGGHILQSYSRPPHQKQITGLVRWNIEFRFKLHVSLISTLIILQKL